MMIVSKYCVSLHTIIKRTMTTPLTPIYTVEQLHALGGKATGQYVLDAVVNALLKTTVLEAKDMAAMLCVPERKLSASVELLTGLTLGQLIHEWRFIDACKLLRNTERPFTEVAQLCGFADDTALNRVMRKRLKTTLYQYRFGHARNYADRRHQQEQR